MKEKYRNLINSARESTVYLAESIVLEFTEQLFSAMQQGRVNRKKLAEELGTSQAYITKVLAGNANFTVQSMVKLAKAVGKRIELNLVDIDQVISAPSGLVVIDTTDAEAQRYQFFPNTIAPSGQHSTVFFSDEIGTKVSLNALVN